MAILKITNVKVYDPKRPATISQNGNGIVTSLTTAGGDLGRFFSSLEDRETARQLARAIRRRDRAAFRQILGLPCRFFFFRTLRFWCVRVICFYGSPRNRVRITFTICIRRHRNNNSH